MNLSTKWLKDFVDIDVKPRDFAEALTMSGSKVEGYEIEGGELSNIIIGKVLSIEKHPDADKLHVCQVDVGKDEPVQIVTGAQNVKQGDIVPVAMDNSVVAGGKKIKKGKLRGVVSNGMLCSLAELGLTKNDFPYAIEDGIFIIQEDCQIGQDIREALGLNDTVFEFEITSNRPDCLSVIGLARETAVTYDKPLKLHQPQVKAGHGNANDHLSVDIIDSDLCYRYCAAIVENIKIEPSPRWLRERLRASGVRPINNIVDITNYVMLEYGHPMHAFDLRYIDNAKINVRRAKDGEKITTLDGVERNLKSDMLVIADANKPVAVAGVMGGEYSGIMDDTTTIVFESACFSGPSVRITAKELGMRTDSSARFEKGLDPANCMPALMRACELTEMLNAGEVLNGFIDCDKSDKTPRTVKFEPEWINKFLGIECPHDRMVKILTDLGFKLDGDDIIVPSFRTDIEHKADIAEEIARIYGYNVIPITQLRGSIQAQLTDKQHFESLVNQTMLSLGCSEIYTFSFISPKYYDKILMPADSPLRNSVKISNPLGEDTSIMRTTSLPSMCETLSRNYNNRNANASLYEITTEYFPTKDNELPIEKQSIVIGMYGQDVDYYSIKGIVEQLLDNADVYDYDIEAVSDNPSFHPGRCAELSINGQYLGIIGELHPQVLENYEIGMRAYAALIDFDTMYNNRKPEKQYKPLPRFPAVTRDIAFLCDDSIPVLTLQRAISSAAGDHLESISLFDVYKGKQIPNGKKSVAYNMVLRSKDSTLTDTDADAIMKRIIKALTALGAELRS